jgi:hypothetical protein
MTFCTAHLSDISLPLSSPASYSIFFFISLHSLLKIEVKLQANRDNQQGINSEFKLKQED